MPITVSQTVTDIREHVKDKDHLLHYYYFSLFSLILKSNKCYFITYKTKAFFFILYTKDKVVESRSLKRSPNTMHKSYM